MIGRHILFDRVMEVPNQALFKRQACHGRQKALCHAERHVYPFRITPLRHNIPMANNQTRRRSSCLCRSNDIIIRLAGKAQRDLQRQFPGLLRFTGDGEIDRLLHKGSIHPHHLW